MRNLSPHHVPSHTPCSLSWSHSMPVSRRCPEMWGCIPTLRDPFSAKNASVAALKRRGQLNLPEAFPHTSTLHYRRGSCRGTEKPLSSTSGCSGILNSRAIVSNNCRLDGIAIAFSTGGLARRGQAASMQVTTHDMIIPAPSLFPTCLPFSKPTLGDQHVVWGCANSRRETSDRLIARSSANGSVIQFCGARRWQAELNVARWTRCPPRRVSPSESILFIVLSKDRPAQLLTCVVSLLLQVTAERADSDAEPAKREEPLFEVAAPHLSSLFFSCLLVSATRGRTAPSSQCIPL